MPMFNLLEGISSSYFGVVMLTKAHMGKEGRIEVLCSPVLAVPEQCGCGGRARGLPKTQVQEEAEGLVGRYSCVVTALVPRPLGGGGVQLWKPPSCMVAVSHTGWQGAGRSSALSSGASVPSIRCNSE